MAAPTMAFVPAIGLRDTAVYVTDPADETAAREQIQGRLDELRNFVNSAQKTWLDARLPSAAAGTAAGSLIVSTTAGGTVFFTLGTSKQILRVNSAGKTIEWHTDADLSNHIADTSAHNATSTAIASRIMMRDASGRAKIAAPSASDDIAIKATVTSASNTLNCAVNTVNLALNAHIADTSAHNPVGSRVFGYNIFWGGF